MRPILQSQFSIAPMTDSSPISPSVATRAAQEKLALGWTHTARFLTTASKLPELPQTELPEIAFVGRSNAGKSTAINTLTQQKRLAFASKTPGRTQNINLFELGPKTAADTLFADLPGYGRIFWYIKALDAVDSPLGLGPRFVHVNPARVAEAPPPFELDPRDGGKIAGDALRGHVTVVIATGTLADPASSSTAPA